MKGDMLSGERNTGASVRRVSIKDDAYNERLRFEVLISNLSSRFVNIEPDQIDAEIERALQAILDSFQFDRCALLGLSPDRKHVFITHAAYAEGIEQVSGDIDLAKLFPWTYERVVLQRQPAYINKLEELPETARQDRENCIAMGIRSFINIPLYFKGKISSLIVLNATRQECSWPDGYIVWLRMFGEIFINALACRNADSELRESESRYRLLFERSNDAMFLVDINSGRYLDANHAAEELTGYSTDELKGLTTSDICRKGAKDRISKLRKSDKAIGFDEVDYVRKDGTIRTVLLSATPLNKNTFYGIAHDITKRRQAEDEIKKSHDEISRLKDRLNAENTCLREEIEMCKQSETIIGQSDLIKYVHYRISQVASLDTTVMIVGETGTGKGLVARAIHQKSLRKDRPMVHLNCAVIPANLIESELFGREKGAFTGAQARQIGRFELADKGTIFLDEIGELPVELQAKLLRVIESGEFERLGGPHTIKVDVRIIASTNRQLDQEISKGRFREDLFYRLNVFPITVPPLRERSEDIPLLVNALVDRLKKKMGRRITSVPQEVMLALQSYSWPGNVRELENVVERAVIMSNGPMLQLADQLIAAFRPTVEELETAPSNLVDMERSHIRKTLEALNWKIEGPHGAANALGLKPSTLRSRMKKLNIRQS